MSTKADISGKQTINIYNRAWAEWILQDQDIEVEAELSGEFQFIGRTSDSLLRVRGKDEKPFLALTELQLRHETEMPLRTMAYAALARRKYNLELFITVIYLWPPAEGTTIETAFHSEFMGQVGHQDFQVIKLWELSAEQALAFGNPALLPFIPLMQGGNTERMLYQCVARIRQEPRALEMETMLSVFAGYVMDSRLIKRILRWEMQVIRESPILQEAFAEWVQEGDSPILQEAFAEWVQEGDSPILQEALAERFEQGEHKATLESLYQTLTIRFEVDNAYLDNRGFEILDAETLRELNKVALAAQTLAEFEDALRGIRE